MKWCDAYKDAVRKTCKQTFEYSIFGPYVSFDTSQDNFEEEKYTEEAKLKIARKIYVSKL